MRSAWVLVAVATAGAGVPVPQRARTVGPVAEGQYEVRPTAIPDHCLSIGGGRATEGIVQVVNCSSLKDRLWSVSRSPEKAGQYLVSWVANPMLHLGPAVGQDDTNQLWFAFKRAGPSQVWGFTRIRADVYRVMSNPDGRCAAVNTSGRGSLAVLVECGSDVEPAQLWRLVRGNTPH